MGGAAWNKEVHRQNPADAGARLVMIRVKPSGDGAGADGNDYFRGRDSLVGFHQGKFHVPCHGACHEQPVRMPGRRHELDSEAAQRQPSAAAAWDRTLKGLVRQIIRSASTFG